MIRADRVLTPRLPITEPASQQARKMTARHIRFVATSCFHEPSSVASDGNHPLVVAIEAGRPPCETPLPIAQLSGHLAQLCAVPLLRQEEERLLFRRMNYLKFQADALQTPIQTNPLAPQALHTIEDLLAKAEQLRNHLVQANVRLVISIVKGFVDQKTSFDEALSEGIAAVFKAVERFDYDRGFRFSTYATQTVRHAIFRLVEQRHTQESRFATNAEANLDTQPHLPNDWPEIDLATDHFCEVLPKMLKRLDDRERLVLQFRFGLEPDASRRHTFVELGRMLGISKERVRQIHQRALKKLLSMTQEFAIEAPETPAGRV